MSKIRLFGTSSGYVEIAPAAAAGNNTLTAPNTVGEIIAKDAAGAIGITSMKASNVNVGAAVTITESGIDASGIGITVANINGGQISGRRNRVRNGAMVINQRQASSYTSQPEFTMDGWKITNGSSFNFDATVTHSTDHPSGFAKSLKVTPDSVQTPTGGHNAVFEQGIEGASLQDLDYGTSAAKSITASFYAKSGSQNNGHQYSLDLHHLATDDTERSFSKPFTVTSSWQRFTFTFPGDTVKDIADTFDKEFRFNIVLAAGPDDIVTETDWTTRSLWGGYSGQSNFMDNTNNEFYLTGVQLEVGTQATNFEHLTFNEDLKICQRYYCKTYSYAVAPGTNYNSDGAARQGMVFSYRQRDNNYQAFCWSMPVAMRAIPTQTMYSMVGTAGKASGSQTDYTVNTNSPHNGSSGVMAYGTNPHADDGYVHFVLDADI